MRSAFLVGLSALFVFGGAVMVSSGENTVMALLTVGFFGLGVVVGLWMLAAPAQLEIGPSGVRQTVLWRRTFLPWNEVHDFRPATIGLANKAVGFDYLVQQPGRTGLRQLNTAIAGVQGALQPGWTVDPHTLANLLNQARERWVAAPDGAAEAAAAIIAPPPVAAGFTGARMNRKVFAISAAAILGVVFGLSCLPGYPPSVARGVGTAASLIFIRIYAARLHDIGRSGWWQVLLYAIQLPAVVGVLLWGVSSNTALGVALLIQAAFTAALAAIPGDHRANRFGPAPGRPSPLAQSEAFR